YPVAQIAELVEAPNRITDERHHTNQSLAMIAREALREERPQEVLMQMKSHRGEAERLLQELLHLLDAGVDALFVHARRARQADAADRVAADLDRHAAVDRDHVRQRGLLAPHRPGLHLLQEGFGGHPEGARSVGLAARVL